MVQPGYSPFLEEALVLIHNPGDDTLEASHGRVHAQHDQHEEEDHRPERWDCEVQIHFWTCSCSEIIERKANFIEILSIIKTKN